MTRLRRRATLPALTALTALAVPVALSALAGCAGPSHADDAAALRDELAGLPGVTRALVEYTGPVTLDSGKVQVTVDLDASASPAEITAVVTTAYAAFDGPHRGEETDLDVRRADDALHLRGFEPEADRAAVEGAAADAAVVLTGEAADSAKVRAEINTQDVAEAPHVETRYRVDVAGGATGGPAAITATLDRLHAAYAGVAHAGWTVQEGDWPGWALGASQGFPTAEERTLWGRLAALSPQGATVRVEDDFVTVALPEQTSPAAAATVVRRHLALLGGAATATYGLEVGGRTAVDVIRGECHVAGDAVGRAVEQVVAAGCSQVVHPGETATEPAA